MTSRDENKTNPSKYKMNHAKRGIALVININKYDPNPSELKERVWSKKDVENLTKTLDYLEFDVKLMENLTKSEIKKHLQQIASIDHKDSDCFLCVVMSHGTDDNFVTRNNELMRFEEIMEPIKECVLHKPKMFFFQVCRGDIEMTKLRASSASSTKSNQGAKMSDKTEITSSSSIKNPKSNDNKKVASIFEHESDLLIYYSTLKDNLSFSENVEDGTIFIKSVCDVFNHAYKNLPDNMSLATMITNINKSVSDKKLQVSVPEFRMTGEIKFLPKNVSLKLFSNNNLYPDPRR